MTFLSENDLRAQLAAQTKLIESQMAQLAVQRQLLSWIRKDAPPLTLYGRASSNVEVQRAAESIDTLIHTSYDPTDFFILLDVATQFELAPGYYLERNTPRDYERWRFQWIGRKPAEVYPNRYILDVQNEWTPHWKFVAEKGVMKLFDSAVAGLAWFMENPKVFNLGGNNGPSSEVLTEPQK